LQAGKNSTFLSDIKSFYVKKALNKSEFTTLELFSKWTNKRIVLLNSNRLTILKLNKRE
jgi:Fe-S cluster biosynthesis and repair protein YggX